MFELSKRKRQQIAEQLLDKRQRMSSVERRRAVEEEYNSFMNTMNNIKPGMNSSSLKISSQDSKIMDSKRFPSK